MEQPLDQNFYQYSQPDLLIFHAIKENLRLVLVISYTSKATCKIMWHHHHCDGTPTLSSLSKTSKMMSANLHRHLLVHAKGCKGSTDNITAFWKCLVALSIIHHDFCYLYIIPLLLSINHCSHCGHFLKNLHQHSISSIHSCYWRSETLSITIMIQPTMSPYHLMLVGLSTILIRMLLSLQVSIPKWFSVIDFQFCTSLTVTVEGILIVKFRMNLK